jgi:hypothetical protein
MQNANTVKPVEPGLTPPVGIDDLAAAKTALASKYR